MATILGIESSCDETAAAVVRDSTQMLSNVIASQHELHREYAGVVPEIASRAHVEKILPVIDQAMQQAGVGYEQIDAVAVGNRPGLIGSLLVGVSAAKALAFALQKPLIGIDHVQAHLYAPWMTDETATLDEIVEKMPAVGLVVSGGHTSLYAVTDPLHMQPIGRTIDDAVGEAFDKAAVILGLGYPGGPAIDKLAPRGDANAIDLPRSLLGEDSLDFSYSGLKTALLYAVRGQPVGRGKHKTFQRSEADLTDRQRADFAAAFQAAAIEPIIEKLRRAVVRMTHQGQQPQSILVGGGVSANRQLRQRLDELQSDLGIPVRVPPMSLCMDNAAMIAGLAHWYLKAGEVDDLNLPVIATTSLR